MINEQQVCLDMVFMKLLDVILNKENSLIVKNNSQQKEFGLDRHLLEKLSVQIIRVWILSLHHSPSSVKKPNSPAGQMMDVNFQGDLKFLC